MNKRCSVVGDSGGDRLSGGLGDDRTSEGMGCEEMAE